MTVALLLSAVVELFADVDEEHPASVSNVVAKTVVINFFMFFSSSFYLCIRKFNQ